VGAICAPISARACVRRIALGIKLAKLLLEAASIGGADFSISTAPGSWGLRDVLFLSRDCRRAGVVKVDHRLIVMAVPAETGVLTRADAEWVIAGVDASQSRWSRKAECLPPRC